jgi:hypothetical protein
VPISLILYYPRRISSVSPTVGFHRRACAVFLSNPNSDSLAVYSGAKVASRVSGFGWRRSSRRRLVTPADSPPLRVAACRCEGSPRSPRACGRCPSLSVGPNVPPPPPPRHVPTRSSFHRCGARAVDAASTAAAAVGSSGGARRSFRVGVGGGRGAGPHAAAAAAPPDHGLFFGVRASSKLRIATVGFGTGHTKA